MSKLIWPAGAVALAIGLGAPTAGERWTLVIGGDTNGYLAPCGCTKPMAGGIERRATILRQLAGKNSVLLENGGLVKGVTEQDGLKSDALVEALASAGVDAINLGPEETRRGVAGALALTNLAPDRLLCSTLPRNDLGIRTEVAKGSFLIAGVAADPTEVARNLGLSGDSLETALERWLAQAKSAGRTPILLLRGTEADARRIAAEHPSIALIAYSAAGTPPERPQTAGRTLLVTPGDKGLHLVTVVFDGAKVVEYALVPITHLGTSDPTTAAIYRSYLERVSKANLLEKVPRSRDGDFVGTRRCISCHARAGEVWKNSAHAQALPTLEAQGHDRDPDCVGCHVVGLEREGGFRSRTLTPDLANVGCESCHGSGGRHASDPIKYPMGRAGEKSCAPCHVPDHSPTFDFETYWKKIAHR